MAVVGSAHVVIRALTDKLQSDIQAGLNRAVAGSSSSGNSAGKAFSDAFSGHLSGISLPGNTKNKINNDAKSTGTAAGAAIAAGIGGGMAAGAAKGGQAVVAAAGRAGGSAGSVFGKMFNSGSGGGGRIFISMALRIAALLPLLGALVGAISSVVSGLFAMVSAAGKAVWALSPLPGLIAAMVQGGAVMLTAFSGIGDALGAGLEAARVPAANAAKAMDGLKTAARDAAEAVRDAAEAVRDAREGIRDAAEGIRDAYEDVSDAIKALRDTEEAAAALIVNAQEAVADARKRRRDLAEDAAEAEEQAAENIADAEEALAKSHVRVQKAQEALTKAREDAEEKLIDLQFATRGGAIAEQRAIMALQDARYRLAATSELPADNRLRQEAQLAYDEAQLNLEMTKERNGDTAKELQEIREKGVDGTDAVVAAQENLVNAQEDVLDATEAVNDAMEAQRDTLKEIREAQREANEAVKEAKDALKDAYEDAPEMISDAKEAVRDALEALSDAKEAHSDAQETLRDALRALEDAQKGLGTANAEFAAGIPEVNKYQEALDKLSPPARTFVEFLVSLRDEMGSLRDAAQAGLFPGLQTAIENLVYGPLFPALRTMMYETGVAIADAAISISESLSTGPFVSNFGDVAEQNNEIIRRTGLVVGDLVAALVAFMDAAWPVTDALTQWIVKWAEAKRVQTEAGNASGELTAKIQAGTETFKQLSRIIGNIWEGLRDIGSIASESGQSLLDSFEKATEKFANFTDNKENVKQLREDFAQIADNMRALGDLTLAVGGAFYRLGKNPAIAEIATMLIPVVRTLEDLIDGLLNRIGDDLVVLVDQILIAFDEISKSGAIEVFLKTMSTALNVLISAFQNPVFGPILRTLVKIGAAMYAISILTKFPGVKFLGKALGGIFRLFGGGKLIAMVAGNFKFLGGILLSMAKGGLAKIGPMLMNLGSKILPLLVRMAPIVGRAISFMFGPWGIAIAAVVGGFILLYNRVDWFRNAVHWVMERIGDAFGLVVDAAKWLWDVLFGHSIFPDIQKGFEAFFDVVGGIFSGIGTFFTETIPNAAQALFNWLAVRWMAVSEAISAPISAAVGFVTEKWDAITAVFSAAKDWVVDKFKAAWDKVKDWVIDPIKDAKDALGRIFGEGGPIRGAFSAVKDWVMDKFKSAWKFVEDYIIGPIGAAKDTISRWFGEGGPIRGFFSGIATWVGNAFATIWNGIETVIINPIKLAKNWIQDIFSEKGPIRSAFSDAVDAIGGIWKGLQRLLATPVNFMIDTVYNDGLRKALNLLPGVDLARADRIEIPETSKASGGVLPGWSPGRDIHRFFSPTAGFLNLSGGEAVMRPEFTRAVGGEAGIARLNAEARSGKLSKMFREQSHAAGGVVYIDGEPMSEIAARQLMLAKAMFLPTLRVMQGSYQPATSYSGTSHTGGGVADTAPGTFQAQAALRMVGFAAWARNIAGAAYAGSGAHVHSVSRIDPTARGHAQLSSWARGEDGLGHRDYGPNPPLLPGLSKLLGGVNIDAIARGAVPSANPGEEEKQGWMDTIKAIPKYINATFDAVKELAKGDGYKPMLADASKAIGHDTVQWINDKIPDEIKVPKFPDVPMPDNPIPNPFDRGGIASGESDVWLPKRTARPERVLSPEQTQAFERLVTYLEKNGSGNGRHTGGDVNLTVQVPQDASARDVVEGIVYEMRRIQRGGRYNR